MKTKILLAILFITTLPQLAHADENGNAQLQKAATGSKFMIGETEFRVVPNAAVKKLDADDTAADASSSELARIGPYSISLGGIGSVANTAQSTGGSAVKEARYGVIVNQRSGAPALLTPRVHVYCKDASVATTLAQVSGGKVLMASAVAQLIILEYPEPAAALAAIPLLRKQYCVKDAEPEVQQSFDKSN